MKQHATSHIHTETDLRKEIVILSKKIETTESDIDNAIERIDSSTEVERSFWMSNVQSLRKKEEDLRSLLITLWKVAASFKPTGSI